MIWSGGSDPRVVACHQHDVGAGTGDLSHQRALVPIAVATCPEDDDHPARPEIAGSLKYRVERIGCMCIVDDDGERLPFVDRLESSRHTSDLPYARRDRFLLDVEQQPCGNGAEHVLDVEDSRAVVSRSRSRPL